MRPDEGECDGDGDVEDFDDGSALAKSADPSDDEVEDPDAGDETRKGFDRWRNESAVGGIGTGIARGLQAVFGTPNQEIAIVSEAPGQPPDADTRLRVILDPDDPTKSIAVIPAAPDPPPT